MKRSILIVAGNDDTRRILTTVLTHEGYVAWECCEPERVIEAAVGCDLVITDFPPVPGHGIPVTRMLRDDARTRMIPILSATTHVMPEELADAGAGVTDTILLPAELSAIVQKVRGMLGDDPRASATPLQA